jgi:hypothetical protein
VNHAAIVRRFERRGDLSSNRERLVHGYRARRNPVRKRWTVQEFQDERRDAVDSLESVYARDVRMLERGEDARLALEAKQHPGIRIPVISDDLQRHLALQPGVERTVNVGRRAAADDRSHLVRTDTSARAESHYPRWYGRIIALDSPKFPSNLP